ncbi:MAG: hypothetical protein HN494_03640 [Opitutae bacterium]|jgi:hypothetical protein|nr:hypothetical protein [Opitutae bacterium]MBT5908900.1 hypothetical protein [Opitutae bacterium]MBT6852620.1 hypothetical protein [Opitutae bacterium]MBT7740242.1 hypothetical protein [Opitutae bacterium]MBT7923709.1 hypothetical protein [Opitutae bacterium]
MKTPYLPISLCVILAFCSCRRFEQEKIVRQAEPFLPKNLYPTERLPIGFTRVAVLPCYFADEDSPLLDYVDEVFLQELTKQRLFETVQISTEQMKTLFGVRRLSSSGELPETFLPDIENATGANGVLLVDLGSYRAYKPLALSIRSKLVDIKSSDFLWAIDETFDAGQPDVILAASQFQRVAQVNNISARTAGSATASPRAFAKYVANSTFSTLPIR